MPRALLSVSDKTGLVDFGRGLIERGYELVSTGGTARALRDAGLAVRGVSEVTGFPEMLDGRVKTLHPAVHAGILARRDRPDDLSAMTVHGLALIDIVAVNLYPFARVASDPAAAVSTVLEQIDVGGPTMVRAAAKSFRDVLVVVDPADYGSVLAMLDRSAGADLGERLALARKAFGHTAAYDATIADVLESVSIEGGSLARGPWIQDAVTPPHLRLLLTKVRDLRYGENPHLPAAWYADGAAGFGAPRVLQGKELSYNNLLDLDAAARIALEFTEPAAVVIKHTNPCGVATGTTAADAYVRAREADALSAFGGIVGLNRPIDADVAKAIAQTFIEAVVAPRVEDEARSILAARTNLRLIEADLRPWRDGGSGREMRSILGGLLVQARDRVDEAREVWGSGRTDGPRVVTRRAPTEEEWTALRFAWRVCAHVKSNAVIFTAADRTLAVGAGQMSRVDAVKVAVAKAGGRIDGSVAASDAFFPCRDGLDASAAAGATAVVQPGGSVRDGEVIAAADEHGLAMVFVGRRHFRH